LHLENKLKVNNHAVGQIGKASNKVSLKRTFDNNQIKTLISQEYSLNKALQTNKKRK